MRLGDLARDPSGSRLRSVQLRGLVAGDEVEVVISVLGDDFILAAELRGPPRASRSCATSHATRSCRCSRSWRCPSGCMFGGSVFIESIFDYRGWASCFHSISTRDYPLMARGLPADHGRGHRCEHRGRAGVHGHRPACAERRHERPPSTLSSPRSARRTPQHHFWPALRVVMLRRPSRMRRRGHLRAVRVPGRLRAPRCTRERCRSTPTRSSRRRAIQHWLGTDFEGTDVLALVVTGARYVLAGGRLHLRVHRGDRHHGRPGRRLPARPVRQRR